jgi:hypothetical protein
MPFACRTIATVVEAELSAIGLGAFRAQIVDPVFSRPNKLPLESWIRYRHSYSAKATGD